MAADYIKLPKDKKKLATVINNHVDHAKEFYAFRRLMWTLYTLYLNGAAEFYDFDIPKGVFRYRYTSSDGKIKFQYKKILHSLDQVVGRVVSMDWNPSVVRQGQALAAIRDRAATQAIAESIFLSDTLDRVKPDITFMLFAYGFVGVTTQINNSVGLGYTADLEVIHPLEILPFPVSQKNSTKTYGRIRERSMTIEALKEYLSDLGASPGVVSRNMKNLAIMEIATGKDPQTTFDSGNSIIDAAIGELEVQGTGAGGQPEDSDDTVSKMVEVRELWLLGENNLCTRYIVQSGDAILLDRDLSASATYCPVAIARAIETGSFYGAGLMDKLFSLHRESEKLLGWFLDNIKNRDKYELLVIPRGQIDEKSAFHETKFGLRYVTVEPEMGSEGDKFFKLSQADSGDTPGKAMGLLTSLYDQLGFPEIFQGGAPGRVDSMGGLQFLDEQANRAMGTSVHALQRMMGDVYRSGINQILSMTVLSNIPLSLPLKRLDESMAGLVFNPQSDTVDFGSQSANRIPDIGRLVFTLKDVAPKSAVARKQEALQLIQLGLLDRIGLILLSLKEGLDFAWYVEHEANAYRKVVRNIIMLFNDGTEPGPFVATPSTDLPDLQLRVLNSFMASPEFMVSSVEVQNEFQMYREYLMGQLEPMLPDGYPAPDILAATQPMTDAAQQQGPMQ